MARGWRRSTATMPVGRAAMPEPDALNELSSAWTEALLESPNVVAAAEFQSPNLGSNRGGKPTLYR
jgi:hypothetical protein